MSLEAKLSDAIQSISLLTRAVDLLSAQLAELNSNPTRAHVHHDTAQTQTQAETAQPEVQAETQAQVQPETTQVEITDQKELPEYKAMQNLMVEHMELTLMRNGGSKENKEHKAVARAATLAVLQAHGSNTIGGLLNRDEYHAALKQLTDEIEALKAGEKEPEQAAEGNDDDFGDESADVAETVPTEDDVKAALRAYAAQEGKPAAIAILKTHGGAPAVKDVPPEKRAAAIKALTL